MLFLQRFPHVIAALLVCLHHPAAVYALPTGSSGSAAPPNPYGVAPEVAAPVTVTVTPTCNCAPPTTTCTSTTTNPISTRPSLVMKMSTPITSSTTSTSTPSTSTPPITIGIPTILTTTAPRTTTFMLSITRTTLLPFTTTHTLLFGLEPTPLVIAPPPEPTPPLCVGEMPILGNETVFVRNFNSPGANDVMGNVAVSEQADFGPGYLIGGDLRVGGVLNWSGNGEIRGETLVGKEAGDFEGGFDEMQVMSERYRDVSGNSVDDGATVINVSIPDQLQPAIAKASGRTIINVAGDGLFVGGFDTSNSCAPENHLVLNFYQATLLKMERLKFCGIVLAPQATFEGATGLLQGHLFVDNFQDKGAFQIDAREVNPCP